jgi:hypothetical protein
MHVPVQPAGVGQPPPINWTTYPKATHPKRLAALALESPSNSSATSAGNNECDPFSTDGSTTNSEATLAIGSISPFMPRAAKNHPVSPTKDINGHDSDSSDEVELVALYTDLTLVTSTPPPRKLTTTTKSAPAAPFSQPNRSSPVTPFRTGNSGSTSQQLSYIPLAAVRHVSQGATQEKRYYVVTVGRCAGIFYDTW